MEKIGKALDQYSANTLLDKLFYFELTLFSFLTGKNDMHLKNFSMIESKSGWLLAPAYDLLNVTIINPSDKEEMALTIEGKKQQLKLEHFMRFGKGLGLTEKQLNGIFKRFLKNKQKSVKSDRPLIFIARNESKVQRSIIGTLFKNRDILIKKV